jgi:hypothetical protein
MDLWEGYVTTGLKEEVLLKDCKKPRKVNGTKLKASAGGLALGCDTAPQR